MSSPEVATRDGLDSTLVKCFVPMPVHEMANEDRDIVLKALDIMEKSMTQAALLNSPKAVRTFLQLKLGLLDIEVFGVVFLDAKHRVIAYEEMFRGTVHQTSVQPRELARRSLLLNASAVIVAHPHPTNDLTPSDADKRLTRMLTSALDLIDVRLLDHVIVGRSGSMSFAEEGLL